MGGDAESLRCARTHSPGPRHPFIGGGFGGKSPVGQAIEAARLAQITGKPVMVMWTRAEEFFYDTFGPAAVVRVTSSMDEQGKITQLLHDVWAAGTRSAEALYDVPDAKVRAHMGRGTPEANLHPFGTGPWRAPGAGTNVFARESQIDIMAAAAKIDPLEFRLRNTKDERLRRVLRAAADAFGWKAAPGPSGQGRAIAVGEDAGTLCALAAQVAVDRNSGAIRVERVVAAQDMGLVINPEGAKMQIEGCINIGLGYVPERRAPVPRRRDPRPQLRPVQAAALLPRPAHRDRPDQKRRPRPPKAAASRPSCRWGRSSQTPSSTRSACGCTSCR